MTRWLQVVSVLVAGAAALGVFQVKYRAESLADQVARLQRDVDQEKEKLTLLKAEWSYLIQPARIQKLAENFYNRLQLQPLEPGQITEIDLLPERPVETDGQSALHEGSQTGPAQPDNRIHDILGHDVLAQSGGNSQ